MRDKKAKVSEVSNLLSSFAQGKLSKEEQVICLHIWEKLARKQKVDITRTKSNIWVASIIWSFCRANFKHEEGITQDLLSSFFDVKKSTIGNKASEICKMLKIDFFNPEFTTKRIQEQNPLNKYVMTENGFIIPKDFFEE